MAMGLTSLHKYSRQEINNWLSDTSFEIKIRNIIKYLPDVDYG